MRTPRRFISAGVVAAVAVASISLSFHTAQAQESAGAEQLFRQGKKLLSEGKTAEACKAFEGSYRKDGAITTLMNLADCREKNGELASAWGYFLDVERLGRDKADAAAFRGVAKDRAGKLEGRLSYLIVNVPSDANVEGLQIMRNGVAVDPAEWNTDIPIDGGTYQIEGKAPGYEAWSTTVTVATEKDKKSVNVPRFRARPSTETIVGGTENEPDPVPAESAPSRGPAVVLLGGGGAMVLAGLTLGYLAQQKYGEAEDRCGTDHVCDTIEDQMAAQELTDAARLRGNLSTVVTAAGVVGIGVGVVLWVRGSGRKSRPDAAVHVRPTLSPDGVGLAIGGSL